MDALHLFAPSGRLASRGPRRQRPGNLAAARGQALVLSLVLLFGGALGFYFMFSTGQVASTRQRLDNAADAAAWSAALWRARVMNYHAYANRAIVAQEVAIAQAVTLASWAKYFEQFSANAAMLASVYPPVAAVLEVSADLARTGRTLTEQTAAEEVLARSAYKRTLAASQEVLQASAETFGLGAVANEVARANDPRFFAFALPDGGEFRAMSRRYAADDRARLKSVVDDSLDAFVAGPRGLELTLFPLPSSCFGNPLVSPSKWFQQLHKRGGTVMVPGFDRWEAADTHSLHDWRRSSGFFGFSGCNLRELLPLGWGAVQATNGPPPPPPERPSTDDGTWSFPLDSVLQGNPGNVRFNPMATTLAEQEIQGAGHSGFEAYNGIETVRELDYAALANPRFPTSRLAVLARAEAQDVRTANVLNVGVGRLRLSENLAGRRLWSVSAAEVYFRRPDGAPARLEYASLYSPYWQVRLVEPSAAQRALADTYVR